MTDPWTSTFPVDEVRTQPRAYRHQDVEILVALVDGEPRAVDGLCLHRQASLAGGVCQDGVITCPSHWWRYDLRDGALQGSPGVHLRVYPTRVVDGIIEVQLPPATPARSLREILLAHARGEDVDA